MWKQNLLKILVSFYIDEEIFREKNQILSKEMSATDQQTNNLKQKKMKM